jgi:hypothetical protein
MLDRVLKLASTVLVFMIVLGVGQKLTLNASTSQVNDYIYTQGKVDSDTISQVEQYISVQPEVIKNKFLDDGWKVVILDKNYEGNIAGHTDVTTKTVYINGVYINPEFLHELAHIYLDEYGMDDDFQAIYDSEAEKAMNAYFTGDAEYKYSNITEYYCSAWSMVMTLNGEDKLNAAPETFRYFTNLFNSLYNIDGI